ncbi:dipeptide/oligopeptide/nickel ABC transporter permease/ATP-binding protein [Solwaraspora sp. WMMB335]|uniref:dipeptide/oligopeptide/nickel ABC transporter permease/ATP-binding protein n=1 Tax=Solwaraspora sp. WMMB335 TaxID=3404118 RepID=UPI003B94580E
MSVPRGARSPQGVLTVVGVLALVSTVAFAPLIWGDAATTTVIERRLDGPGAAHWFGTDELGRDLFARTLVAARLSVLVALGSTAIAGLGGVTVGVGVVLLPRMLRRFATAAIEILMSFPWLLLTLFFSAIWGASVTGAMLAVGFAGVPTFARLTYTSAASVNERDYVRAARIVGVGPVSVVWRHILPNIRALLLVNTAAVASATLLAFTGLSFLGLGVQAPAYDWGRLLRNGIEQIYSNPMAALGPGMAVVLTGLVLNSLALFAGQPVRPGFGLWRLPGSAAPAAPADAPAGDVVAVVSDLRVSFPAPDGHLHERVRGVSFCIRAGETVGLVGASGSGKSVTAMALAGLLGPDARVDAAALRLRDIDMAAPLNAAARRRLGLELAMVFQDPLTSLNPALTIGRQLTEVSEVHERIGRSAARKRARESLATVTIDDPARRVRQYPHELSGGMRQRVMIGMGLMGRPRLLIADEPTTALDVTVQRTVLRVLHRARRGTGSAILLISHDIALVSTFCDRVLVMRDGEIVEELAADRLHEARHPYTRALIACVPHMTTDRNRPLAVIP